MMSGLGFLVAARQCEIDELEQLAGTIALAQALGELVHQLQRERGLSNLFVGSGGGSFGPQCLAARQDTDRAIAAAREHFDQLPGATGYPGSRARLFSRIAYALHGLDALAGLRQRLDQLALDVEAVTAAYCKLIASLLSVVFDATDNAADPEVSRLLLAYFNFVQGKEYAGQERAAGAAAYASGRCDARRQQQLLTLIDAQEECLQTFGGFADARGLASWQTAQDGLRLAELERLRRIVCTAPADGRLDPALSMTWFEHCTARIDAMKQVENALGEQLRDRCEHSVAAARRDLHAHEAVLQKLVSEADAPSPPTAATAPLAAFFEREEQAASDGAGRAGAPAYGPRMEREILAMLREQARRLQATSDELATVRAALNERKVIERAKGLLMAHRQLSEEAAYRMLRQTAMEQNRRLVDVAESVLALSSYLSGQAPAAT
jgi:hypothetical protein